MLFFGDSGQLTNRPAEAHFIWDEFNRARRAWNLQGQESWWWLRSPGDVPGDAAIVSGTGGGGIGMRGVSVIWGDIAGGVRPVMWLKLYTHDNSLTSADYSGLYRRFFYGTYFDCRR